MCLAIPGKIVKIEGDNAIVDYVAEKRAAKIFSLDVSVGDYVIVQQKIVVQKILEKEALAALKLITAESDKCAY